MDAYLILSATILGLAFGLIFQAQELVRISKMLTHCADAQKKIDQATADLKESAEKIEREMAEHPLPKPGSLHPGPGDTLMAGQ